MYLARKITLAKWHPTNRNNLSLSEHEIAADAVTGDLRTKENTLSFWRCPSGTQSEVEEAALAIAATWDRTQKLCIIWLDISDLQVDDHEFEYAMGHTPVTDLTQRHVNICNLDYVRLGKIAERVTMAIQNNRYRLLTKEEVKNLLVSAAQEGRFSLSDLSEGLQGEIKSHMGAS